MNTTQLIILCAGTVLLVFLSWHISLKDKRYHGIARFFAFECILILCLLNYPHWFRDPLSTKQLFSWFFLCLSIYPAVAGVVLLRSEGKPEDNLEKTVCLVTTGIYHYIRHPMYLSLLLLGLGIMLKRPGFWQLLLAGINIIALVITARMEEKEMQMRFGDDYSRYMKDTKMFIPFVF